MIVDLNQILSLVNEFAITVIQLWLNLSGVINPRNSVILSETETIQFKINNKLWAVLGSNLLAYVLAYIFVSLNDEFTDTGRFGLSKGTLQEIIIYNIVIFTVLAFGIYRLSQTARLLLAFNYAVILFYSLLLLPISTAVFIYASVAFYILVFDKETKELFGSKSQYLAEERRKARFSLYES